MAKNYGIGYSEAPPLTVKVAGASPGYDPFTKSIGKGKSMSAGPISISKATATPSKSTKITMKKRG
jgi:hypothetical protein